MPIYRMLSQRFMRHLMAFSEGISLKKRGFHGNLILIRFLFQKEYLYGIT